MKKWNKKNTVKKPVGILHEGAVPTGFLDDYASGISGLKGYGTDAAVRNGLFIVILSVIKL